MEPGELAEAHTPGIGEVGLGDLAAQEPAGVVGRMPFDAFADGDEFGAAARAPKPANASTSAAQARPVATTSGNLICRVMAYL